MLSILDAPVLRKKQAFYSRKSIDANKIKNIDAFTIFYIYIYNIQNVSVHLSVFTCQLTRTRTTAATDPPTANSPTMHTRLVCQDRKCCLLKPKPKTPLKSIFVKTFLFFKQYSL